MLLAAFGSRSPADMFFRGISLAATDGACCRYHCAERGGHHINICRSAPLALAGSSARHQPPGYVILVIGFICLTLLGFAMVALEFISAEYSSGDYSLLVGDVFLILFGLTPFVAILWFAVRVQRAKRGTHHPGATEHDHHDGPPASASRA